MLGKPTDFWGKLEMDATGQVVAWHPLLDHCVDVGMTCEALLQASILRRRLARLAELSDLSPTQVARLSALATLHDLGKFNHGFQAKDGRSAATAGHVTEAVGLMAVPSLARRLVEALGFQEIATWGASESAVLSLLIASVCHHGRPVPLKSPTSSSLWLPRGGVDPFEGLQRLSAGLRVWFPEAFSTTAEPLPDSPRLQHAFSGLVTLADWIGSTKPERQDQPGFHYSVPGQPPRAEWARTTARRVVASLGLATESFQHRLESVDRSPWDAWGIEQPTQAQSVLESLPVPEGGGLEVLEAETGSGKTEAAVARFLTLFRAGAVDGIYFALPTRTAATQLHARIHRDLERLVPDAADRPAVVLAVPGYLRSDDRDGQRLPHFRVLWPDEDHDAWRSWATEHPKRYLAGCLVVGTIDQVLLGALTVKHAHLRRTSLLRHLLVVDEVHASDPYMTELLGTVLNTHLAAGGHALLLSATLGAAARGRFLAPGRPCPAAEEAIHVPYPAIHARSEEQGVRTIGVAGLPRSKRVRIEPEPWIDEPVHVARRAFEAAGAGARVLVVRNTVAGCLAVQQELEGLAGDGSPLLFTCNGVPTVHHGRFTPGDRKLLDRELEARFRRDGERACVVVTTQTAEQSLDIDADLLITDLCPADVFLQRIGRLWRHDERQRPAGVEQARAILLTPLSRDLTPYLSPRRGGAGHGLGNVYPDVRCVEATWRLVEARPEWHLPGDNRSLVEASTHPDLLERIAEERGEPWLEHARRLAGKVRSERRLAEMSCLDDTVPFGESAFPDLGEAGALATRLGLRDRLAVLPEGAPGPFGEDVKEMRIPGWMAGSAPNDEVARDVEVQSGSVRFRFGDRRYSYDRLGLKRSE